MTNKNEHEAIPESVIEALLTVRDSGAINMFDRESTIRLAQRWGYRKESVWLKKNPGRHMEALRAMGKVVTERHASDIALRRGVKEESV